MKSLLKSKLVRDFITLFSGDAGAALFSFGAFGLMAAHLGADRAGLVILIQTYAMTWDALLNFQSWQAVIKFGAEARAQNDDAHVKAIIRQGVLLDFGSALLTAVIAIFAVPFFVNWLHWPQYSLPYFQLFAVSIFFHLSGTPVGVLRLFGRFKSLSAQKVLVAALRFAGCVYGFFLHHGWEFFVLLFLLTDILGNLITVIQAWVLIRQQKLQDFWIAPLKEAKQFFTFAIWTNLSSTADLPIKLLDVFIIQQIIGLGAVGVYKLYKQGAAIVTMVSWPFYQISFPSLSAMVAEKRFLDAWKFINKSIRLFLIVGIPLALVGGLVSPWFFQWLWGREFAESWVAFAVLLLFTTSAAAFTVVHPFFVAQGFVRQDFLLNVVSNVIYLGLLWILGSLWGLMGIVLATGFQMILVIVVKYQYLNWNHRRVMRQTQ